MRIVFHVLAAAGTGIFTGVMLNIGLTLGVYWKGLPPEAFLDWFSANSGLIGRTIPIVLIPTLLGLIGSLWFDWTLGSRPFWIAALAAVIALLAITVVYHLPTNAAFAAKSVPLGQVSTTLNWWLWLHGLRIVLGASATVCAILALTR